MVGSSISEEDRRAWNRVIGIGFVAVVGGSAGLIGLANDAPLTVVAGLTAGGLVVGVALVYYLASLSMDSGPDREFRRR
jgi:hypothetical protein